MLPFAILCAAVLHDPSPDDVRRFGFDVRPLSQSIPRLVWNQSRHRLAFLRSPVSEYVIHGREREIADMIDDAHWRERVWDAVDDMARECASAESRMCAARRLREKLGPVAYWLGELPEVE